MVLPAASSPPTPLPSGERGEKIPPLPQRLPQPLGCDPARCPLLRRRAASRSSPPSNYSAKGRATRHARPGIRQRSGGGGFFGGGPWRLPPARFGQRAVL